MNLKQLSNETLEQNLVELFSKERSLLCIIILHVMEIERRKSYECSNATLFDYLMKLSKYTHGTTQRRIDAAMLALEIPEILHAVKSGELNQNQIICAQMGFRQVAKQNKKQVSTSTKLEVIKAIYGKTVAESEVIIASKLGIKPKSRTTVTHQADGSVVIKTVYSKEDYAWLNEAKLLLSHSVPSGAFNELTTYMAKRVVAYKTKLATEKEKRGSARKSKGDTKEDTTQANAKVNHELKIPNGISVAAGSEIADQTAGAINEFVVSNRNAENANLSDKSQMPHDISESARQNSGTQESGLVHDSVATNQNTVERFACQKSKIPYGISRTPESKPHEQKTCPASKGFTQNYHLQRARKWIPAHIRRAVFAKYNCCQHKDPVTGKICGSRWQMQIDHIQPIWAGGTNEFENLHVLCGAHNRMVYRKQAGIFRARPIVQ